MTNQKIADSVIKIFFEVGIDGETMEYIIDKLGMRDQMIKQLITDKEEPEELSIPKTMAIFTRQQLIEYTREIQERCKSAITEAVNDAGIEGDEYIELELDYNNTIQTNFDDRAFIKEIESVIDNAFETDDDSVFDEATNVITFMTQR
jgi:hypothetical protein